MFTGEIFFGTHHLTNLSYRSLIQYIREGAFKNTTFAIQFTIAGVSSPIIEINASNLYLLGTRSSDDRQLAIPQNLMTYNDQALSINLGSLQTTCVTLTDWANGGTAFLQHDDIKTIAFLISEAARFESVKMAIIALFHGVLPELQWLDWEPLLRAWSAISPDEAPCLNAGLTLPINISNSSLYAEIYSPTLFATLTELRHAETEFPEYGEACESSPVSSDNSKNIFGA